jgi:hypothetical protein
MLAEQIATGRQPEGLRAFDPLRVAVKWRVDAGCFPVASGALPTAGAPS